MRPHAGKRNDKSRVRALNICRIFLPQRNWRVHKAGAHDPLAIPTKSYAMQPYVLCRFTLSARDFYLQADTMLKHYNMMK